MLPDVRYATRRLVRSPGFTVAVVLTLAVGIGANTAVFTVVNTVLLSQLPVPEPDRVVRVYTSDYSSGLYGSSSYPNFADYRDRAASFTDLAAYTTAAPMNMGAGADAERIRGAVVTADFFEVLGMQAALGRFFPPSDDTALGSSPVAVLSHELWQRNFSDSPEAVGREITLNGSTFTVIGVAPERFRGFDPRRTTRAGLSGHEPRHVAGTGPCQASLDPAGQHRRSDRCTLMSQAALLLMTVVGFVLLIT